jgi:hypothetical protein
VLILGICCTKDAYDWVVVEGADRGTAKVVRHAVSKVPAADRGEELSWVRKEVLALVKSYRPDRAVLRVAEKGGPATSISPGRCEVEGVVQEALSSAQVPVKRATAATIRAAYASKTREQLDDTLLTIPLVKSTAKARQGPLIAALSDFAA